MEIKPIRTEEDYLTALKEIETLFDAEPDSPEGEKMEVLVTLVEAYEEKNYKIPLPDPIESITYHMERLGLDRKDLEPYIGNRARVSEILNRKRSLSLRMIRNLSKGLGIPTEILVQEYPLDEAVVEDESVLRAGTASVQYQEQESFYIVFSHSAAGNDRGPSKTEMIGRMLFYSKGVGTRTNSISDCFSIGEGGIPMRVSHWPGGNPDPCKGEPSNQAGNTRMQRIVQ